MSVIKVVAVDLQAVIAVAVDLSGVQVVSELLPGPQGIDSAAVNTDWDATTGPAELLNKPTIPTSGTDFDPVGTDNSDNNAANTLYSGLVSNVDHPLVETAVPPGAVFTDTIPTVPVSGTDFDPVGTDNSDNNAVNTLYSGLVSNVDHPLVETAVPAGAVFTDTIPTVPVSGVDFDPVGTDNSDNNAVNTLYSGLVSNVDHPLVETAVPAGAVFTDTTYTIPVSGTDFDPVGTDNSDNNAPNTLYSGLVSNVDHPLVETAVPPGAVFTDTPTDISGKEDTGVAAGLDADHLTAYDHAQINISGTALIPCDVSGEPLIVTQNTYDFTTGDGTQSISPGDKILILPGYASGIDGHVYEKTNVPPGTFPTDLGVQTYTQTQYWTDLGAEVVDPVADFFAGMSVHVNGQTQQPEDVSYSLFYVNGGTAQISIEGYITIQSITEDRMDIVAEASYGGRLYRASTAIYKVYNTAPVFTMLQDPTGFNRADLNSIGEVSVVGSTVFVDVLAGQTEFSYYNAGTKVTHTTQQSVTLPTLTEGMWYIYFNESNVLSASQTPWLFVNKVVFVANLYWDATNSIALLVGDERHGNSMPWSVHEYLHKFFGSQWEHGFTPTFTVGAIDNNGDLDTDAELLAVAAGSMTDEDIENASAGQTAYQIFYREGVTGAWRATTASAALVDNAPAGRAYYNEWTGATWQRTEVPNADFVLVHQYVTNQFGDDQCILVMGQATYTNTGNARDGAEVELLSLATEGLPTAEFHPIATFIIQTRDTYDNVYKSRLRSTDLGDDFIDWRHNDRVGTGGITIQSAEQVPVDAAAFVGSLSPTDLNVQVALTTLDAALPAHVASADPHPDRYMPEVTIEIDPTLTGLGITVLPGNIHADGPTFDSAEKSNSTWHFITDYYGSPNATVYITSTAGQIAYYQDMRQQPHVCGSLGETRLIVGGGIYSGNYCYTVLPDVTNHAAIAQTLDYDFRYEIDTSTCSRVHIFTASWDGSSGSRLLEGAETLGEHYLLYRREHIEFEYYPTGTLGAYTSNSWVPVGKFGLLFAYSGRDGWGNDCELTVSGNACHRYTLSQAEYDSLLSPQGSVALLGAIATYTTDFTYDITTTDHNKLLINDVSDTLIHLNPNGLVGSRLSILESSDSVLTFTTANYGSTPIWVGDTNVGNTYVASNLAGGDYFEFIYMGGVGWVLAVSNYMDSVRGDLPWTQLSTVGGSPPLPANDEDSALYVWSPAQIAGLINTHRSTYNHPVDAYYATLIDLNALQTTGYYRFGATMPTNNPGGTGFTSSTNALLRVYEVNGRIYQFLLSGQDTRYSYTRQYDGEGWSAWVESRSQTNAEIATGLTTDHFVGWDSDGTHTIKYGNCSLITVNSTYFVSFPTVSNGPSALTADGTLETHIATGDTTTRWQIFTDMTSNGGYKADTYYRRMNSGSWTGWELLSGITDVHQTALTALYTATTQVGEDVLSTAHIEGLQTSGYVADFLGDLDTKITTGVFRCVSGSTTNMPEDFVNGIVSTVAYANNAWQTFYRLSGIEVQYTRRYLTGTWFPWVEVGGSSTPALSTAVNLGASISGAVNLDLAGGDSAYFYGTAAPTQDTTFTVINPPAAGTAYGIVLDIIGYAFETFTFVNSTQGSVDSGSGLNRITASAILNPAYSGQLTLKTELIQ